MDYFKKFLGLILIISAPSFFASNIEVATKSADNHNRTQAKSSLNITYGDEAQKQYLLAYEANRQERPNEALVYLKKAKSLGYHQADWYLQRGLANFQLSRFYEAVSDFKRYDRMLPNQPKTNELLGRCYALLGNTNEAERYFNKAEQSPALHANIMRFKKGLRLIGELQKIDQDKPWSFTASLGGGYNSNVIALGNNFALPSDISRQSSQFGELLLFGHTRLMKDDDSSVRVLYQFLGNLYESISSLNLLEPFVALEYRKELNPKTNFSLNISSDNSWVGGIRFSSFNTAKPTLTYQADRWNSLELVYLYSNDNFFTPTTAVLNRDGFTQLISVNDYVNMPNSNLVVRFGYAANWSNTKGSDFSFHGNELYAGFRNPISNKLTLEGVYTYGLYRYDNLNSLSGVGGFNSKRRDNTNRYFLQLLRDLNRQTKLYARYEHFDDNANIPLYSYQQYIISLGLTANWS